MAGVYSWLNEVCQINYCTGHFANDLGLFCPGVQVGTYAKQGKNRASRKETVF